MTKEETGEVSGMESKRPVYEEYLGVFAAPRMPRIVAGPMTARSGARSLSCSELYLAWVFPSPRR